MSREIKFRGVAKDLKNVDVVPHKGIFVYGNLVHGNLVHDDATDGPDYIVGNMVEADEEYCTLHFWEPIEKGSAEQFTGLKDKNGKDIYEGDILAWHSNICRKHDWVGLVLYRGAGFAVQESDKSYSSPEWLDCACRKDANIIEVIGNIHTNPELLEDKK
ncbi:YopX family protein [Lentilactobacillus hilgardii]|nr:YopX family protein [Lentilactobacillus hilgardii]KRK54260.1 hypothetical protein FD42_GL001170 [Lentilactobacillus hilgardii DSM 20176 = ATCC 8290]QEU39052.1 hypothetical protein LH500_09240 [Lentilactobacillus hilgardii]TDG82346.1 hypothetical protein C5L34_002441 [Lentilactobacillus hilgardii]